MPGDTPEREFVIASSWRHRVTSYEYCTRKDFEKCGVRVTQYDSFAILRVIAVVLVTDCCNEMNVLTGTTLVAKVEHSLSVPCGGGGEVDVGLAVLHVRPKPANSLT